MSCPDFEKLMLYLDGELDEEDLRIVREHLEDCEECRRILATQSRLEESWRNDFRFPEGSEFRRMEDRIFGRVHGRRGWRSMIPVAAGIIAVLLGVKLILTGNPSLDRVSSTAAEWTKDYTMEDTRVGVPGRTGEHSGPEAPGPAPESPEETAEQPLEEHEELVEEMIVDHDGTGDAATRSLVDETSVMRQQVASDVTEDMESSGSFAYGGGVLRGSAQVEQDEIPSAHDSSVFAEEAAGLIGQTPQEEAGERWETGTAADDTALIRSAEVVPDMTGVTTSESDRYLSEGLEEVEAQDETVCFEEELVSCPPEYFNRTDDGCVALVFDGEGMPDSLTAVLLDSLSPGWRDYIKPVFMDTVMVVPLADLNEILRYGGGVPAETTE
ncbi:MAG: hypothetical protein AVO35_02640 [Candidatus Aegiribacteria sp. MLS_C]|nr:MAG: hypothetical protein AVO35_02640 [Candidatus Aegiribacteria sp. MLS_C]